MDIGQVVVGGVVSFEIRPGAGDAGCVTSGYLYCSLDGTQWSLVWRRDNLVGWTTYSGTETVAIPFRYVRANTDGCSVDWCSVNVIGGPAESLLPIVVMSPLSQEIAAGRTLSLTVDSFSSSPLRYAWQRNGLPLTDGDRITGATTANLRIADASPEDSGSYAVTLTNGNGSTNSAPAMVSVVFRAPEITVAPTDLNSPSGSTLRLEVVAAGSLPMSYQWRRNGLDLSDGARITGSRSASVTLAGLAPEDAGLYSARVCNVSGCVTTLPVSLGVLIAPPGITRQPQSQMSPLRTLVVLNVDATGSEPLTFQWQLNGEDLVEGPHVSGARTRNLRITDLSLMDLGSYTVTVGNAYGSIRSVAAELSTSSAALQAFNRGNEVELRWSPMRREWVLQRASSLEAPQWASIVGSETTNRLTLPFTPGREFFRLFRSVPVLSGPIVNPATGHRYSLLVESSWTEAEEMAEQLGGTLAVVDDEAENQWLFDTFAEYGGVQRGLWIGLTDQTHEGVFEWVDGTPVLFARWAEGEPSAIDDSEDWVHIFYPQDTAGRAPGWNDCWNVDGFIADIPIHGVVEVP